MLAVEAPDPLSGTSLFDYDGRMPPKVFDIDWQHVDYRRLARFLAEQEGEEPLHWEAKADGRERLGPHAIRKSVCGFANSHDGGYLIVGAENDGRAWRIVGLDHPPRGELGSWLDRVIRDGLRPSPRYEIRVLRRIHPKVAIVAVEPVAEPPCITNSGSVYVRTAGTTGPVQDPAEMARLFARGEAARASTEVRARRIARDLFDGAPEMPLGSALLTLGVASTGAVTDRASRLFMPAFGEEMLAMARRLLYGHSQLRMPGLMFGQGSLTAFWHSSDDKGRVLQVRWNGSAGLAFSREYDDMGAEFVVGSGRNWIKQMWTAASRLLISFGEYGQAHIAINVRRRHPGSGVIPPPIEIRRWHALGAPNDEMVDSIMRELRRALGDAVWEGEA